MVSALIAGTVPSAYRAQALQLYPPGNTADEARSSYVQILTDRQFTSNVRRTARAVAPQQSEPVWRYFFTHRHAGAQGSFGSYHGIELFYVFNTWENAPNAHFTPDDTAVQAQMLQYWVNFARSGNPNGAGLAMWPQFDSSADCYLQIAAISDGSHCGLRTEKSDFWDLVSTPRSARL
jgi:para-nitrobenzyl esterase